MDDKCFDTVNTQQAAVWPDVTGCLPWTCTWIHRELTVKQGTVS